MKKTITINLQGMLFHVEEDGYVQLSHYLESIRTYFSSYEGHEEIISDIEGRIAEIFSARLSPIRQAITFEDVESLIGQMGSVADFQLLDDDEPRMAPPQAGPANSSSFGPDYRTNEPAAGSFGSSATPPPPPGHKRLYRDESRKILGGVASGIALYLKTDPALIRLLLLALMFAGGFGLVLYIICWIALPPSQALPDSNSRKLFRDPDRKILGGVSSGLGLYLGLDATIVRIIFLALLFAGGFSLIAYILLWVAIPEARTITEKVQMHGNPVTLSSIEESLKKSFDLGDENGQENQFIRLLMLPIRLVAQLIKGLAKVLGPLFKGLLGVIRLVVGILLLIVATAMIFASITALMMGTGMIADSEHFQIDGLPVSVLSHSVPGISIVAGFLSLFIPGVFLFLLAIVVLTSRFFLRATLGWPMFALWLLSLFTIGGTAIYMAGQFNRTGEHLQEDVFAVAPYGTIFLEVSNTGGQRFMRPNIEIQGYPGSQIRVRQRFTALGQTEDMANNFAQMASYQVVQKDSLLHFSETYAFKPDAIYRKQRLALVLQLPQEKSYRISRDLAYLLPSEAFNQEYSRHDIAQNTWQLKDNRLVCLTCPPEDTTATQYQNDSLLAQPINYTNLTPELIDLSSYGPHTKEEKVDRFDRLEVDGLYHLLVRRGDVFQVTLRGEPQDVNRVQVRVKGGRLVVNSPDRENFRNNNREPVLIEVKVPHLRELTLKGAVKTELHQVSGRNFRLVQEGASQSLILVDNQELEVTLEGASTTTFRGRADRFKVKAEGACHINAAELKTRTADLNLNGASHATVHVTENLKAHAAGISRINYSGNPKSKSVKTAGPSSVSSL